MSSLQITLITIFVLLIVMISITYFVRKNYYKKIDELNKEKNIVFEKIPYDKLEEVKELNLTGQSLNIRDNLKKEWKVLESEQYPMIENYLCGAERATDSYRLPLSKKNQEDASEAIKKAENKIKSLKAALSELIQKEEANLKKVDSVKKRYHSVRKSLLAYSFSYGPASETFENKLNEMEESFAVFSDLTVSGDHEEANKIVQELSSQIDDTQNKMDQIPPLLVELNEKITEFITDLKKGYAKMTEEDYLFPNDTILEDIQEVEQKREETLNDIKNLEIKKSEEVIQKIHEDIEVLYQKMEQEIETKSFLPKLIQKNRKAIYYLNEENRRIKVLLSRIIQSYILNHGEAEEVERLEESIGQTRAEFAKIENHLNEKTIPFSIAHTELETIFDDLYQLNQAYEKLSNQLEGYRTKELVFKNDLVEMEQSLYEMKRALENERLPGLPESYLELFFSTSDRVEKLSSELARTKLNLIDIQRLHKMCEEDVVQLSEFTEEIIKQVDLLEIVSQRLYRYKDSHKGILETIRYSETIFANDYDFEAALRLVSEKLEKVEPGLYKELVKEHNAEENEK